MKVLGFIGDVDAITYGGGYVVDWGLGPELVYFSGLEVLEIGDDVDDTEQEVKLYRVPLQGDGDAFMDCYDWIDVEDLMAFADYDEDSWVEATESAIGRAHLVYDAANYWGWENFDMYPVTMTLREVSNLFNGYAAKKNPSDSNVLSYGVMPRMGDFLAQAKPHMPLDVTFRGDDARVAVEIGFYGGEVTDEHELYTVVRKLTLLWNKGDDHAGSLAAALMEVVGYEWV